MLLLSWFLMKFSVRTKYASSTTSTGRSSLAYGLHVTDRAHMTCLVFNYSGRHLHFIDGADGGLFSAAKAFKERVATLST